MIEIRYLQKDDFDRGFLECLSSLHPSSMSKEDARDRFDLRFFDGINTLVALDDDTVVGTASWFVEHKFLHGGSQTCHVEDVAVLKERQGEGIGKFLMDYIVEQAETCEGCYKLVLDCSEDNVSFYERCGLHKDSVCMKINLTTPS